MFGLFDIIQKGGPLMYLIILCSIVALAVVIERLWHLYKARINTQEFMEDLSKHIKQNKIVEAIDFCDETPGPIAYTLKAGILKHDQGKADIKEAIEEAALEEVPRLEKNFGALATIAHITPLLGLLGTVAGMIRCFQVIQIKASAFNPISPGDLAEGIWMALITTAAGLTVAIPTLVAYNYLVSRANNFILDMERSATELINILSERSEGYEV